MMLSGIFCERLLAAGKFDKPFGDQNRNAEKRLFWDLAVCHKLRQGGKL